ncbi:structural protein [Prochlorococcus phage P-SSM7]|uniref:Structural protein n=1 Tax=Prochlorococcus phage P-SSM7 TaxID=445688 RepID=E3SNF4_9CAUD|nr:tail fiber protein [Prochlorococcus phage P-SSM7]ADO99067.1 structural protein [Prochlorococcus phage P-SSM7]
MAKQGLLAQLKPSANTDTVLYSAPINRSASTVLTIANDGTGSAYDVAVKNYDQKFTLDAATYKLHAGDLISSSVVEVGTPIPASVSLTVGDTITTTDKEKSFKFESFYIPTFTEIFVKVFAIRAVPVESVSGTFAAGNTISKGSSPNDTTAVVYGVDGTTIHIGPSTLNGTGTEFAAGDSIGVSGGASATISASPAITAANNEFTFSTTTAGGVYRLYVGDGNLFELFDDRTYRFNVADGTMSGRDFHLSETVNGEFGPDGAVGGGDDGTEFTTGKTTNGTAGSGGAYVQYAFGGNTTPTTLYIYDGGTGTASNANYGGVDRFLRFNESYTYPGVYVFDKVGTIVDNTDTFLISDVTYTITSQTAGAYGYVRDYTGSVLTFIKGLNSGDFSGSDTFRDVPKLNTASRTTATINSVDVASAAVEVSNYLVDGDATGNNEVDKITSLVVGPGETIVVKSTTANNIFSLVGFEDASSSITTRIFGQS